MRQFLNPYNVLSYCVNWFSGQNYDIKMTILILTMYTAIIII